MIAEVERKEETQVGAYSPRPWEKVLGDGGGQDEDTSTSSDSSVSLRAEFYSEAKNELGSRDEELVSSYSPRPNGF